MAQLTAGLYLTRGNRIVNLLTSSVVAGATIWAANLLGPIGGSDPLGVDTPLQYQETGVALPNGNTPPITPLATTVAANAGVASLSGLGSNTRHSDLLAQVGATQSTLGARG